MLRNITSYLESNPNSTARQISEGTDIPKRQVNGILYKYRNQHYSCVYSCPDHPLRPYWSVLTPDYYQMSEEVYHSTVDTSEVSIPPTTPRHNHFWTAVILLWLYYLTQNRTSLSSSQLCLTN